MRNSFAVLAALSLLATAAHAQEPTWPEPVTTAFFSDADFTTLRPADEIAANWALLTQQDRQTVLDDCAALPEQPEPSVRLACEAIPEE